LEVLITYKTDILTPEYFLALLQKMGFSNNTHLLLLRDPDLAAKTMILGLKNNSFLLVQQLLEQLKKDDFKKYMTENIQTYLKQNKKIIAHNLLELVEKTEKNQHLLTYYFDLTPELLLDPLLLEKIRTSWREYTYNNLLERYFEPIKNACTEENKQDYIVLCYELFKSNTKFSNDVLNRNAIINFFGMPINQQAVDAFNAFVSATHNRDGKLNDFIKLFIDNIPSLLNKQIYQQLQFRLRNSTMPLLPQHTERLASLWSDAIKTGDFQTVSSINQLLYDTPAQLKQRITEFFQNESPNIDISELVCLLTKNKLLLLYDHFDRLMEKTIENILEIVSEMYPQARADACVRIITESVQASKNQTEDVENKNQISNIAIFKQLCNPYLVDTNIGSATVMPVANADDNAFDSESDDGGFSKPNLALDDLDEDAFGSYDTDYLSKTYHYNLPLKVLIALSSYWPDPKINDLLALSYPINFNTSETLEEIATAQDFLKLYTFCQDRHIDSTTLSALAQKKWPEIRRQLTAIDTEVEEGEIKQGAEYFQVLSDDAWQSTEEDKPKGDEEAPFVTFRFGDSSPKAPDAKKEKPDSFTSKPDSPKTGK
jgi:hypothetical protein